MGGVLIVPPIFLGCHNATGATAGGQIGYRWQAANWVFGVEAQGNWADFKGSNANPLVAAQNETKIEAFGLFTGQVGYSWNNVLLYVKGGAAVVSDKYRSFDSLSGLTVANASETRWGGAVGAGLEFGFAPNWTVGVEYDHLFMGHRDASFFGIGTFGIPPGTFVAAARIGQDVDIGLVRVNYRWGGPVVAKY
jgi:outer membrane immunogenic protein